MKGALALALLLLLGACVSGPEPTYGAAGSAPSAQPTPRPTQAPPPQTTRPPAASGFRAPTVMALAGLEPVIGRNATALANLFGPPRLTVKEGDALKLQFVGSACTLDVFLYPLRPGAEPTATHLEARRASDALDVDRAACVRALMR